MEKLITLLALRLIFKNEKTVVELYKEIYPDKKIKQIKKVSNQYHVYYSYQKKGEVENYTVNHTANMYLLNEKNEVEKIFIPGTPFSEFYKYVNRYLMKDIKNLPLQ